AAGQAGQRLTEGGVAETDLRKPHENPACVRYPCAVVAVAAAAVAEELPGLGNGHSQHLGDGPAAERVVQHSRLEAAPATVLAGAGHALHHREVGVNQAGTTARG